MSSISVEKKDLMEKIKNFQLIELEKYERGEIEPDYCEMVELYHGTTLKHLNNILENGLLGRKNTGISNYDEEGVPSNDSMVYLSNKWYLTYALSSNDKSLVKTFGKDLVGTENLTRLWEKSQDIPIVICVSVPKNCLVIDEDIVFNRQIASKIRKGELKIEDISIDKALEIGTVACFYEIKAVDINSIYFIGNEDVYTDILSGWYSGQVSNFFNGIETQIDEYDVYSILLSDGVASLDFNDFMELTVEDGKHKSKVKLVDRVEFNDNKLDIILKEEEIILD